TTRSRSLRLIVASVPADGRGGRLGYPRGVAAGPQTALFWDIDLTLLTTGRAGLFAFEDALREVCGVEVDLRELRTSGMTDVGVAALVLETAGQEPTPELIDRLLRSYERRL